MIDTDEDQIDEKTTTTSAIIDQDATDATLPVNTTFRYTTEPLQNRSLELGTTVVESPGTVLPLTTSSTLSSVLTSTVRFETPTVSSPLTSTSVSSLSHTTNIEISTTEIVACRGNQCSTSTTTLTSRNVTEVSSYSNNKLNNY